MKMLHIFLFLASCGLVRSDEQMLLQQGVGVFSSVEFQRAADELLTELEGSHSPEAPLIRSLVKSIKSASALDAAVEEKVNLVIELIDKILAMFVDHVATDNAALEQVNTDVAACNIQGNVSTEQSDFSDAGTNHVNCRREQVAALALMDSECASAYSFNLDGKSPFCTPAPAADFGHMPEIDGNPDNQPFKTWLTNGLNYFTNQLNNLNGWYTECTEARTAYDLKEEECDGLQTDYDTAGCELKTAISTMCSGRASCYSSAITKHNDEVVAIISPISERRVSEAAILRHAKCFLNNIKNGETDMNTCEVTRNDPQEQQIIRDTYNVTHPTITGQASCPEMDPVPGSMDFIADVLATMAAEIADWSHGAHSGWINSSPCP